MKFEVKEREEVLGEKDEEEPVLGEGSIPTSGQQENSLDPIAAVSSPDGDLHQVAAPSPSLPADISLEPTTKDRLMEEDSAVHKGAPLSQIPDYNLRREPPG